MHTQREAAKLQQLGTPADMPGLAREGFLALVMYTAQSGSQEMLAERISSLRERARLRHEALDEYTTSTCPNAGAV